VTVAAPLAVCRAAEIGVAEEGTRWLVREVWARAAVGIVGGAPKCCKSWFALDLAVSVASGTPALGRFEVEHPAAPALVFLAEDSQHDVRARLASIAASRALDFDALDVRVIVEPVVRLDLATYRDRLVATLEVHRPAMLLLDPLVRLHRLDENSAQEVSGLLGYLRELQRAFDCAVVLVHHASKRQRARPGQSLRGSSDLHAFGDSNAYLADADDGALTLTLEHRSAAALPPFRIRLVSDGPPHLEVVDVAPTDPATGDLAEQVLAALRDHHSPTLRRDLRERLKVSNNRLGDVLIALQHRGAVIRTADGWSAAEIPNEPPRSPPPSAAGAGAPLTDLHRPRCPAVGPSVGAQGPSSQLRFCDADGDRGWPGPGGG